MSKMYFALQGNQVALNDQEIEVTMMDADGRRFTARVKQLNELNQPNYMIAKNSAYYGDLMKDCHIFNPYLHRRFLPVRFTNACLKVQSNDNLKIENVLLRNKDMRYAYDCIINELETIIKLQGMHDDAYEARSGLLPLWLCTLILNDFVDSVLSNERNRKFKDQIEECKDVEFKTYQQVLRKFRTLKSYCMTRFINPYDNFVTWYICSGVYWTLYHLVAFGDKALVCDILETKAPLAYLNELVKTIKEVGTVQNFLIGIDSWERMLQLLRRRYPVGYTLSR